MALGLTNRGTGTHNTSATSFTLSPSGNFAAGSWGVICVAADNSAAGGSTNNISNVTDTIGNTWTVRRATVFDPGAANAGVQLSIWTTDQDIGPLQTGTVITVSFGAATVAKTWTLTEATKGATETISYVTGADDPGAATAAPTLTTVSITSGNAVIAAYGVEAGTTQTGTGDADTTNGSWTTAQYAEVGSTTSGSVIISQGKVVTGTATQTYNPTLGISSDTVGAYVVLHAEVAVVTVSPALLGGFVQFSPTMQPGGVSISPALLGGATLATPAFRMSISPPLIGPSGVVFTPSPFQFIIFVDPVVASGLVHAPSVGHTVAPAVLGGGQVFTPAFHLIVTPALLGGASIFAPIASHAASPQTVTVPFIASTDAFDEGTFDPLSFVAGGALLPFIDNGLEIQPALLGGGSLFSPLVTIQRTVFPTLISLTDAFDEGTFDPLSFYTFSGIHAPGVTIGGFEFPLIDQIGIVHTIEIVSGSVGTTPGLLGGYTLFAPQLGLTFTVGLIDHTAQVLGPVITGGLITIAGTAPIAIATNLRPSGGGEHSRPVGVASHSKPR